MHIASKRKTYLGSKDCLILSCKSLIWLIAFASVAVAFAACNEVANFFNCAFASDTTSVFSTSAVGAHIRIIAFAAEDAGLINSSNWLT